MDVKLLSLDCRIAIILLIEILPILCQLFSVNEEVPIGTSVGFVVDRGSQQRYNYYLEPRDSLFKFHDSRRFLVVTNSSIDKESLCPYQEICQRTYDVMVNRTDGQPHVPLTRINITINDINDHGPEFPVDHRIVISIPESASPGSTRQKLPSAEDLDHGLNGNVTYSFVASATSPPSAVKKFALGKYVVDDVTHMLLLVVMEKLDRETEDEYNLTIMAEDGGIPKRTAILEVKVQVGDHNDNAPQFESSNYTVRVPENLAVGSEIVSLKASDADLGDNAKLKFTWSDETLRHFGNIFSIDSNSGCVRLKLSLDREEKDIFHLTAIVSDAGKISLSSHSLLTVHVEDFNDNPPVIALRTANGQLTDKFEITENSKPEEAFGRLIVTDADAGPNARISCDVRPQSLFLLSLQAKRGRQQSSQLTEFHLLTAVSFDREIASWHEMVITCRDDGEPQLTSNRVVRVEVLDENDNAPVFERSVYRLEIEENTEIGTKIFQLEAKDADDEPNSKIDYQLEPQQARWKDVLKINENGEIYILKNINCEENSQMMFIARALNSGDPPRIGEAGFELTVRDQDEHIPIFDRTLYEYSRNAEIPENSVVGQVSAVDRDCSTRFGKVVYRLEDTFRENVERFFHVEKNSGEIHSRILLDESKIFKFSVVAGNPTGRWFPESKAEVVVKIDIDRGQSRIPIEAPIFYFPNSTNNSVTVLVGSENKTAVCQLQVTNGSLEAAKKLKSDNERAFKFAILSGNKDRLLAIDEATGWIRTATDLKSAVQLSLNVSVSLLLNSNEYTTTASLVVNINKQDAISSDHQSSFAAAILDYSVLIAILLASSAFLIVFCITVFVVRCHLTKRKRRPRRYNCRLETVKAASNCSLNGRNHRSPDVNAISTMSDEQNHNIMNSLQKFNRFVSFNVDDDFPCGMTDSRMSCPFRDNCSLHKPFATSDFDEMNYLNERDMYNLPSFSTQSTSLYSTQKSLPDENHFKSFKPLRVSPIDRPSSSSSGLRHLSPSSFFPITCSSHLNPSLPGFNYANNNSKEFGSTSNTICDHRQPESQI